MSLLKDHITIYDIARRAGVSIATVSRVLTGKENVKEETRKKVQQVIDECNYEPNLIARALCNRISNTIGMLVEELSNPFFVTICNEAEVYCTNIGYTLLFGIINSWLGNETELLHIIEKRQVDGFIFLGGKANQINPKKSFLDEIRKVSKRLPIVFINSKLDFANCYTVRTDERQAFAKIVNYVISCKHKKIGLITGERGFVITDEKIEVFKEVLARHKMPVNEEWIVSGQYLIDSGASSMQQLLDLKDRPTAVMCTNDTLALGAIKQTFLAGLTVPDDVSVTGFDDIFISKHFIPGITTVKQDYHQLAELAVKKILSHVSGEHCPKETTLDAELMIRDSCKTL
ncbi:MAG: LacI family DNA-binding transcriptional regulator [Spirochaetales bacterium]|nr:LacI family DNA-binding transcriptional regulator [Spirochaetales bacterium]